MLSVSTESGMNVLRFRITNRKLTSLQKPQAEYADMPAFCAVESSLMWIMRDCSSRASIVQLSRMRQLLASTVNWCV